MLLTDNPVDLWYLETIPKNKTFLGDIITMTPTKMAQKVKRTAVVLQGGGAYGAFELGAMKAIYDKGIEPDVVTGVSIGAINAAVIAGCKNNNPVEALNELWCRLTVVSMPWMPNWLNHLLTMPCNPGMYSPNPELLYAPFKATSYSDTGLLKKTLNDLIDWEKLNDPERSMKLAVTALNIKTGQLSVFRNYKDPDARDHDVGPPLNADHIIASGSLPPAFPKTEINGSSYWDGGLFNNTPLKPAFKALQAIKDKKGQITTERKVIVLSLFPPAGEVPKNMTEVETRKTETAFGCKIDFDKELYKKITKFRAFAELVQSKLPKDRQILDDPGFQRLMAYKPIDKLIEVKLEQKETQLEQAFMPGADFTWKTIRDRAALGEKITNGKLT